MNGSDYVLNAREAAEYLGAHVETVRRLARKGEIPAFKVGKDWRFRRRALLRWNDEHHLRTQPPCVLVVEDEEIERLNSIIEEHYLRTRSSVAKKVLDEWDATLPKFVKVYPRDYRRVLEERKAKMEEQMIEEVA